MAEKPKKIAAVLIRGPVHVDKNVTDTLHMLRMRNKNVCVVLDCTPIIKGMLNVCKDYITWGEVSDETVAALKKERGETMTTRDGKKKDKPYFRLHPPRGGFERKGIKVPHNIGGALGYRGEKINDLIKKML
ncbi:MAG: uL30 family ribosomal protein [Nanoarchaeota archaeon]|mgnify:CR=1 FL=1